MDWEAFADVLRQNQYTTEPVPAIDTNLLHSNAYCWLIRIESCFAG